jgi:hypothetical protein
MESNEAIDPARPDAVEDAPQPPQQSQLHPQLPQPPRPESEHTEGRLSGQPETRQPEIRQPETGRQETTEPPRAPLSADPGMPERFRNTVRALDEIDDRPVVDHAETYDAVHRDLRSVLDDVDRSS